MGFDRRNFFRTIGVAGVTLAVGKSFGSPTTNENVVEFQGMLYDSTRCLGCRACERVCAKAHDLPEPKDKLIAGVLRKTNESQRTVINNCITSKGELFVKKQCMHCNEPACTAACLTQAMYKTKEGPVIWRGDKCMGCRYCMVSCPFDVPKFEFHSANPKIQKCDLCYDRFKAGKIPSCAEACPGDAITFGTRRELIDEARKRIFENPKDYVNEIYGENVAGGTGILYLAAVKPNELGFNTKLQNSSYPALTKGFLYSVPSVDVLLPPLLLAIYQATKNNNNTKQDENE